MPPELWHALAPQSTAHASALRGSSARRTDGSGRNVSAPPDVARERLRRGAMEEGKETVRSGADIGPSWARCAQRDPSQVDAALPRAAALQHRCRAAVAACDLDSARGALTHAAWQVIVGGAGAWVPGEPPRGKVVWERRAREPSSRYERKTRRSNPGPPLGRSGPDLSRFGDELGLLWLGPFGAPPG